MPSNRSSPPLRLDGYIRVSSVGKRRGERFISPTVQREQIEAWAVAHGHRVLEIFEELDESGGRADRPLLRSVVERVEAGISQGVVVWKLDRFSRSLIDGLVAIERVTDAGGNVYSVRDGLDARTDSGRLMLRMVLSKDQFDLERMRESWDIARAKAIARGVFVGSRVPVGYRRTRGGRLRPDAGTGPVVSELFRRRAGGESGPSLARWLEQRGVLTAWGNPGWSATTVYRVLANEVYLGTVRCGRHVREHAHEPLTDPATWQLAQHPRGVAWSRPGGSARRCGPSLLTGLVRCGSCSMRMCAITHRWTATGRVARYYCCRGRSSAGRCPAPASISAAFLEPHVEDVAFELLGRRRRAPFAQLAAAERKLAAAEQTLAAYRDSARVLAVLGERAFADGLAARADNVRQARLELAGVRARHALHQLPATAELEGRWPAIDLAGRRELIGRVIDCVFVAPGRLRAGERITVCPAGTAPVGLPQPGDKHSTPRSYRHRRGWINPSDRPPAEHCWSRGRLERELRSFLRGHSRWPAPTVFDDRGRRRLHHQVVLQGGEAVWAHRLGLAIDPSCVSWAPWTDERIRAGLQLFLADKQSWPTIAQFERAGLRALRTAVTRSGGLARWADEFPLPLRYHPGGGRRFWTDQRIRAALAELCADRTWFPSCREFAGAGQGGLLKAIQLYHGTEWWANELGLSRAANRSTRPASD